MSTLAMPMPATSRNESSTGLSPMLRGLLVSAAAVLATGIGCRYALARLDQPVRQVAITGAGRHVSTEEVRAAIAANIQGRLLQVDLQALRVAVERIPWVASARVDRVWPAELAVHLRERELFARWGEHAALSTEGVVFAAREKQMPETLPRLDGPEGREHEVMEMYRALADRLTETAFAPTGVSLDARGDWSATTTSGVLLRFGRGSPLKAVDRLKTAVLPALASRLNQIARIDLRYANGFAVAWRDGAASTTPQQQTTAAGRTP